MIHYFDLATKFKTVLYTGLHRMIMFSSSFIEFQNGTRKRL